MAGDVTVARRPVLDSPADYAIFALIVAVAVVPSELSFTVR